MVKVLAAAQHGEANPIMLHTVVYAHNTFVLTNKDTDIGPLSKNSIGHCSLLQCDSQASMLWQEEQVS